MWEKHVVMPKASSEEICKSLMKELNGLSDNDWEMLAGVRIILFTPEPEEVSE